MISIFINEETEVQGTKSENPGLNIINGTMEQ